MLGQPVATYMRSLCADADVLYRASATKLVYHIINGGIYLNLVALLHPQHMYMHQFTGPPTCAHGWAEPLAVCCCHMQHSQCHDNTA